MCIVRAMCCLSSHLHPSTSFHFALSPVLLASAQLVPLQVDLSPRYLVLVHSIHHDLETQRYTGRRSPVFLCHMFVTAELHQACKTRSSAMAEGLCDALVRTCIDYSPGPIVCHYLRHPTFSRFDTIPE